MKAMMQIGGDLSDSRGNISFLCDTCDLCESGAMKPLGHSLVPVTLSLAQYRTGKRTTQTQRAH
eukprot:1457497-Amphidinium_carterae.1